MRMRWQEACWPRPLEQARRTTHALVFWVARVVSRRTHATDNFNFVRPSKQASICGATLYGFTWLEPMSYSNEL